jgi:hypothetical protein
MARRVTGRRARGRGWRARLVGTCAEHPRRRIETDRVGWTYYPAPIVCPADPPDDGNGSGRR